MALKIRPLEERDIEAATQSGLAAWVSTIYPTLKDFGPADLLRIEAAFKQFLTADLLCAKLEKDHLRVGDLGGQIVGFYNLEQKGGHLTDLWVAPQWQGHGIATAMMHDAKETALRFHEKLLILEVMMLNHRAVRFYRKEGFEEYDRKMCLDPILRSKVDKSLMRFSLDRPK